MSGLKQLRDRIKTIKSTRKITKAMHVVSAAKLKKIKEQAEDINLYSVSLAKIMGELSKTENIAKLAPEERRFFINNFSDLPHLLVVMTTERGLCGGFNSNIIRQVKLDIKKLQSENKIVKLLIIGKKGIEALKSKYSNLIIATYYSNQNDNLSIIRQVKNKILALESAGEIGQCTIYYNRFKNVITQLLTSATILPVQIQSEKEEIGSNHVVTPSQYEYEGDDLVQQVVDLYLGSMINYGLLQNKASEEGARMTAMDNATNNADELIEKLTLQLNRSRQATITTELTEIISGAEAAN